MRLLLFIFALSTCGLGAIADELNQVLIFEPMALPWEYQQAHIKTDLPSLPKPKSVDAGIFEKTIKTAIQTFENSMRKTCTREMETSISVTADGKWAVVGVSITGSMRLVILNPEMLKHCSK
jgi:hypothetical protein